MKNQHLPWHILVNHQKPRTLYIGYWHKDGQTPETIQAAVTACLDSLKWYGLVVASDLTDEQVISVASLIEASDPVRVFGHTTQAEEATKAQLAKQILLINFQMQYRRTFCIFSSTNAYASASVFGRAFSVNFNGTNTTITLKFEAITRHSLKI